MPEYLQEVLNHQPTYNIDTTKHIKETDYEKLTHDAITAALNQKLPVPDDGMFQSMFQCFYCTSFGNQIFAIETICVLLRPFLIKPQCCNQKGSLI